MADLMTALRNADAAGDEEAAKRIVAMIKAQPQERSFTDKAIGVADVAASIGSGVAGDIAGGLAGIGAALNPWGEGGDGARTVESVRSALSYSPQTEAGKEYAQAVGGTLEPVGNAVEYVTKGLGSAGQKGATALGASPEVAGVVGAALETAPAAAVELLGLRGLRSSTQSALKTAPKNVKAMMKEAAPTIEQLKAKSGKLYDQLDKSTAKIKPEVYNRVVNSVVADVGDINSKLYPKSAGALEEIVKGAGEPKTFKQLNELRQIVADAAFTIDKADARLGKKMLAKIDMSIDKLSDAVGGDAKGARELWKRAKVAESISDMVENAGMTASGFENGLRIEARKILKSPRKSKGFSKAELSALAELERGSTAANAAKFMGKFGISEGKATSMLGAATGATAGGMAFGGAGAVGIPLVGQAAKYIAQRLTSKKSQFVSEIARAGGNGRDIVSAYMRNTPADKRSVSDLTSLLLDPKVSIDSIEKISAPSKIVADSLFFAKQARNKAKTTASGGAIIAPTLGEEDE